MLNNFPNPKRQPTGISGGLTFGRNAQNIYTPQFFLNSFVVPRIQTKTVSRAFSMTGPALKNALPVPARNVKTILTFRKLLKSHLFDLAFPPLLLSGPDPVYLTNLLWSRLRHKIALRICAPLSSVR